MGIYKIADGHNNTAGLTAVDPQPASYGIHYPRRVYATSGAVYPDGIAFTEWRYDEAISAEEYDSLLTQFGLDSAETNDVTIYTSDEHGRDFVNKNGTIIRPENPVYRLGVYERLIFLVRDLEDVT